MIGKRFAVVVLGVAVLAGIALVPRHFAHPGSTSAAPMPELSAAPIFVAHAPVTPESISAGSPLAAELNAPDGDALHDVQTLHALLRQYLRVLHHRQGPPIGDDIDLAHVLTGHNPMNFVVIPNGHPALSKDGHIRDRWGTPYFIHPIGYGAFEIRSAGPDRKLFTDDDAVDGPATGHTDFPDDAPGR